ncbi:hypothetical protein H6503_02390 [Candidatus Woesearchaeota archaeon]|nr:hypothetical protein [Candidatus Woesearchaeota archaeon]
MDLEEFSGVGIDNLDMLEHYFEISSIDDKEGHIIRNVRRKIVDKLESIIITFSNFVNPDSTLIQIHDAQALDDKDRLRIVEILKDLARLVKEHQVLEIDSEDVIEKKWIKESLQSYIKHLKSMKDLINKIKESYDVEDIKIDVSYLG